MLKFSIKTQKSSKSTSEMKNKNKLKTELRRTKHLVKEQNKTRTNIKGIHSLLNLPVLFHLGDSAGRLFHIRVASYRNVLMPYLFVLTLGTSAVLSFLDL